MAGDPMTPIPIVSGPQSGEKLLEPSIVADVKMGGVDVHGPPDDALVPPEAPVTAKTLLTQDSSPPAPTPPPASAGASEATNASLTKVVFHIGPARVRAVYPVVIILPGRGIILGARAADPVVDLDDGEFRLEIFDAEEETTLKFNVLYAGLTWVRDGYVWTALNSFTQD